MSQVREWTWKPDYISVNVCEEGSVQFAELLQEKGVPIEYGIFTLSDAMAYVKNGFISSTFRVLIEVSGQKNSEDIYTWDIIRYAQENKLNYRIGFEDIDRYEAGNLLKSNVELYLHVAGLRKM